MVAYNGHKPAGQICKTDIFKSILFVSFSGTSDSTGNKMHPCAKVKRDFHVPAERTVGRKKHAHIPLCSSATEDATGDMRVNCDCKISMFT